MKVLLKNKRYSDAEKASEDETYREELYKEYKLQGYLETVDLLILQHLTAGGLFFDIKASF